MIDQYDYEPPIKNEVDLLCEQQIVQVVAKCGEHELFCGFCDRRKYRDGSCVCHLPDLHATADGCSHISAPQGSCMVCDRPECYPNNYAKKHRDLKAQDLRC